MISRQRCQLSFHGKLFNAFFVRHILPQIQGIDPTTQHGVSFLFQFLWKLDAIRILREIYSRGNKHHPTLLYVVILSNKNNARTPAAQLRCGFLIKELGAIFYISCIPIHFNPGKKKNKDRLVKLCQAEGTLQSDTPHPSCHVDEPGRPPPFLGVMFFSPQRVGSRGEFQMWCSLKIVNLGWNLYKTLHQSKFLASHGVRIVLAVLAFMCSSQRMSIALSWAFSTL